MGWAYTEGAYRLREGPRTATPGRLYLQVQSGVQPRRTEAPGRTVGLRRCHVRVYSRGPRHARVLRRSPLGANAGRAGELGIHGRGVRDPAHVASAHRRGHAPAAKGQPPPVLD